MNQRTVRNERIDLRKRLRRNARELQQACGITAEFFDNLRIQAQGLHTNHAVQRAGTAARFYLAHRSPPCGRSIGRASCRERVCQSVSISVVAVSLKKKTI